MLTSEKIITFEGQCAERNNYVHTEYKITSLIIPAYLLRQEDCVNRKRFSHVRLRNKEGEEEDQ